MTHRLPRFIAFLSLIASPLFLIGQETTANEDERIEQLVRSEASEWYTPKNSVTVGFRVLTSGANVRFGNLGSIAFNTAIDQSTGAVNRTYDNGFVNIDAARSAELDANGNQVSTPGGRYYTYTVTPVYTYDSAGNVISTEYTKTVASDSLSYTPGLTRTWGYSTPQQAADSPGYIAMSSYSAVSDGGFASKKEGASPGIELQFAHALRKLGKKTELSVITGIGINGINSKTSGDVKSTLKAYTDYYSLNGLAAPVTSVDTPYSAPSYTTDTLSSIESTTPIGQTVDHSFVNSTAGAATVHGIWQIKGAYFMVRVGPSIRTQFTEHLAFSASVGLAGAYAGTRYSATETMEIPVIGTTISSGELFADTAKFLGGFFADANMEWTANDSMGIYGGVSAQKFGDYTQELGVRSAVIDLGTSVGIRGGINIKF